MREQLIQYVELLFAGATDSEDIKQEILQNTLDRYDDLVAAGKVPEAAYRLAIAGIGDINEILGTTVPHTPAKAPLPAAPDDGDTPTKKLLRAIAVGLYILSMLPLIIFGDIGMDHLGLCGTVSIVAVATVLIMLGAKKSSPEEPEEKEDDSPQSQLGKSVGGIIWAAGLALYFLISFTTGAWYVTWVIFPILGAADTLVTEIIKTRRTANDETYPSKSKIRKSIGKMIWALGIAVYFIFSFATSAWYMTWLVFPITGAVQGLFFAIWDLKEVMKYET